MPGSIIFKPLEVNLSQDTTLYGKPDPYCIVSLGDQKIQTQVGEKIETFQEEGFLALQVSDESTCLVELKDHDSLSLGHKIGACQISLDEIETKGSVRKWYPIYDDKDHATGKILLEATYTPENQSLTDIPSSPGSGLTSPDDFDEETMDLDSKGTQDVQESGGEKELDLKDEQLSPPDMGVSGGKENRIRQVRHSFDHGRKEVDDREEYKVDKRVSHSGTKRKYLVDYQKCSLDIDKESPVKIDGVVGKSSERKLEESRNVASDKVLGDKEGVVLRWDV